MDELRYNAIVGFYTTKMCRIWRTLEYNEIYNELWVVGRGVIDRYDEAQGSLSNYLHIYFQWKAGYHLRRLVDRISTHGLRAEDAVVDIEPELMAEIDLKNMLDREPDLWYALAPTKEAHSAQKGVCIEQCRRKYQLALERASWRATADQT